MRLEKQRLEFWGGEGRDASMYIRRSFGGRQAGYREDGLLVVERSFRTECL